jgi:hypothetical protein
MEHDIPFKADETKVNQSPATKHPQAMLDLPSPDPSRPKLKNKELMVAKQYLIHKDYTNLEFPRKTKFRADPTISGQHIGLITFIPSSGAVADADGCYGVMKFRGAFSTEREADQYAEMLLRQYDSYSDIDYVFIGKDFPLFQDNSAYVKATREIDVRKKVEEVAKEQIQKKREEERKQIEDIEERQKTLLDPETEEQRARSITELDYYIELRVKKAHSLMTIDEAHKRIKEAEEVIKKTQVEIISLDEKFPDYQEKYYKQYINALEQVGADASKNPVVKFMGQ